MFDSVALGEGLGVGDDCSAVGEGDGNGDGNGEGEGIGEGDATTMGDDVCGGVGDSVAGIPISVLFCERNAQNAIRIAIMKTTAPIANGFQFGPGFFSPASALCFIAASVGGFSPSVDCSSNSLIADATAGVCFDTGWESASSQCGVLR